MAQALLDLTAVLLVLVMLRSRPAGALTVLGASLLVAPGPLVVPHAHTTLLTLPHLLTLAGGLRVLLGRFDGTISREHLRVTPPQLALVGLLLFTSVVGLALSPVSGPLGAAPGRLADVVDHLLFLTVALVLVRQTSPATALRGMAVGLLLGLVITVVEHVTGNGYGHALFRAVGDLNQDAAFPLSVRDGAVRVRAGTEFALQYAWVAATLAPALLVMAWRRGGAPLAAAAAAFTLTSVYWSYSRTALAATALVTLVTCVVLARRAWLWVLLSTGSLGAAALLQSAALRAHLDPNSDIGSVHERTRRLTAVMEAASHHPFRGLGLGELSASGFHTTDFSFLIAYVELGVGGLVAVAACLLFALRAVLPAVATHDPTERDEAVAAALGVTTFVLSTFAYDAFTLVQGTHALWLAVAAGVVLVERRQPSPLGLRVSSLVVGRAVAAAGAGLFVGLVVAQTAPRHAAQRAYFSVLDQRAEAELAYDPVTPAQRFVNTVCGIAEQTHRPDVKVSCSDTFGAAGYGQIRVQAANTFALRSALTDLSSTVQTTARITTFRLLPIDRPRTGSDTWARTAPLWGALAAGVLALLLSPRPRPRDGHEQLLEASGAPGPADVPAQPEPAGRRRRGGAPPGPA